MVLVVVLSLAYGSVQWVGMLVLIVIVLGMQEYRHMLRQQKIRLHKNAWLISGALLGLSPLLAGVAGLNAMLVLVVGGWILHELVFAKKQTLVETTSLGWALLGLFWVAWSFAHMTLLKSLPQGEASLFLLLLIVVLTDTLAYFGGRWFGKTPLAPGISPKKTREGSFCGTLGSCLIGTGFAVTWLEFSFLAALLFTLLVSLLSQVGDLAESKLKRMCGVKDSGVILPGHGGILDRTDGFLLTTPFFYYWLHLFS
jgi:phosphatidate cytidylyltransferase